MGNISDYYNNLKGPIENILLLLGSVLTTLGFFTLFFSLPMLIANLYLGWPWIVSGSILFSIGFSFLYFEVKLTKIKIK